ncbi:hypothetical protein ALI144C_19545 [Actinosynnema sp. ALI-1.44]|uniref:DUF5995 family protein n=1 Tax=Actinosynnema sp. ALI-1.44 TaxID=1933779 RepID=UPI00097C6F5A|nr:DUF5995 family protein [Actinosynnema sp. ALI-1.44]ONI81514.1 hypothetical protein ALI144C_19545 [Actinosynnema sp. ALI-1.44]
MTHTPVQVPDTIEKVIQRMRTIDEQLDPRDGVACFNRMYMRVTELVGQHIVEGTFKDPQFLERMDIIFAGLYFKAVDAATAKASPPAAWKPLLDARHNRTIWPLQFALAGMNAHINHDLALAVNATCKERHTTPSTKPVHADYLTVNDLLEQAEAEVRAEYEPALARLATADAEQLKHILSSFSIARARDVTWGSAVTLWQQQSFEPSYTMTLTGIVTTVTAASMVLLTPVVPPPS